MAWNTITFELGESWSDKKFYDNYWTIVQPIWTAFQEGKIGPERREKELKVPRARLHRLMMAMGRWGNITN